MKHLTELQVSFAGDAMGILALRDRQCWFQYDAHWIQQGFDLSPQTLNFTPSPQLPKLSIFQGLHGVFHDSLPDGWGLLLMDRFFKRQFDWDYQEITSLDRLAYLGKRPMGALEYAPAIAEESVNNTVNLMTLVEEAQRVLEGRTTAVLNQLRILGGSPGGARPKVTIGLADDCDECIAGTASLPKGFSHWLVKFHGALDPKDMGRIEKMYAELASKAGLEMSPSRLLHLQREEDFFAVQRFDRNGNSKRHMLTLSGYLYADHRVPSVDYDALLTATQILTKDLPEVKRAFRLMVFNIVMHNKDDHAKNFCFLRDRTGDWQLAPGYDLTFSQGMHNQHTTAIYGNGNPSRKEIRKIAEAYEIDDWENILNEVLDAVSSWKRTAKKYHVTAASINRMNKAFNEIKKQLKK